MKLSVVIPAHNEEGCIEQTLRDLHTTLADQRIDHELVVINDNSSDGTETIVKGLSTGIPEIRLVNNTPPNGFGYAVRAGLRAFEGDAVAIYMADASDSPKDLVRYYRTMIEKDVDCVFGSRFRRHGKVYDYPVFKLVLNRIVNLMIQILFGLKFNDTTNAFKLYRRHVVEGLEPLISPHFNLTVEMPLKSIVRGYTYAVVPISWTNRKTGVSKLKIQEMGSRYLFIILYCFIEKWLSRGDYRQRPKRTRQAVK
jgi:dolichol-phosphate mannosyltransferase